MSKRKKIAEAVAEVSQVAEAVAPVAEADKADAKLSPADKLLIAEQVAEAEAAVLPIDEAVDFDRNDYRSIQMVPIKWLFTDIDKAGKFRGYNIDRKELATDVIGQLASSVFPYDICDGGPLLVLLKNPNEKYSMDFWPNDKFQTIRQVAGQADEVATVDVQGERVRQAVALFSCLLAINGNRRTIALLVAAFYGVNGCSLDTLIPVIVADPRKKIDPWGANQGRRKGYNAIERATKVSALYRRNLLADQSSIAKLLQYGTVTGANGLPQRENSNELVKLDLFGQLDRLHKGLDLVGRISADPSAKGKFLSFAISRQALEVLLGSIKPHLANVGLGLHMRNLAKARGAKLVANDGEKNFRIKFTDAEVLEGWQLVTSGKKPSNPVSAVIMSTLTDSLPEGDLAKQLVAEIAAGEKDKAGEILTQVSDTATFFSEVAKAVSTSPTLAAAWGERNVELVVQYLERGYASNLPDRTSDKAEADKAEADKLVADADKQLANIVADAEAELLTGEVAEAVAEAMSVAEVEQIMDTAKAGKARRRRQSQ